MARRRVIPTDPTAAIPENANVPAWVATRGPEFVEAFLAQRAQRRQQQVDDLIARAPLAVMHEGEDGVRTWAEALADDPRLIPLKPDDPRAPLPPRRDD